MGGTFDPVHNGHLAAARQCLTAAGLERVWLMPNARPPHRTAAPVASAEDRMRMVELAVQPEQRLKACRIEVERGGVSYTIDTIRELGAKWPGRRFVLLLGADAALQVRAWRAADAVLQEANFVLFNRPEVSVAPQTFYDLGFAPERTQIVHLDTPPISAHQVRDRLARGVSIDDLVPPSVAAYISERGLYRS